jgi:hypothetical protein
MSEEKPLWSVERVRQEIYDARTKLFVVVKVLETGTVPYEQHPEWLLVIGPLLKEIEDYAQKLSTMLTLEEKIEKPDAPTN